MGFQPFTSTFVDLEHLGRCVQWSLPMGGTLTVGWGHSPHHTGGQHVGTGRLWARLAVPVDAGLGVNLPFSGWFHWSIRGGLVKARQVIENSGGFLAEAGILADYWEAAYFAECRRADELEACVKKATAFLESDGEPVDEPEPDKGTPYGLLDGAYSEELVGGEDDGEALDWDPDEAGTSGPDWDPCGSW